MAAQLKPTEDGSFTSFTVKREGFEKLEKALSDPKKPTAKLIALMKSRKKAVKK